MIIYHYSNNNFSGKIEPKFFGSNSYTSNSARLSEFKRVYFYTNKNRKEYFFNGSNYLYTAIINEKKLYDIITDDLNLLYKFNNNTDFFNCLKHKGYIGIIDNCNGLGVACLFKAVKIYNKIALTK